ncbi:GspE/PulE family protein [Amphibiibacter pelophylacis]|uniref:ATPase, T2SS/T4P/T4SS family n=1 Tax=Amphibiibacter pelophylacis TaxID=1799477 RepID=A0ACC6NYX9_9BURK
MTDTATAAPAPPAMGFEPRGRLDWTQLLRWLEEDGWLDANQAQNLVTRLAAAPSRQHALVRLGLMGWIHPASGRAVDVDALTEWLAGRTGLPFLRIDPLKVDVGRVAEVMSASYAVSRGVLPVKVDASDVTIATSEPYDRDWVGAIEQHTRRRVHLVLSSPVDIARYTTEFYALAKSMRSATRKADAVSGINNFEQLVELGRASRKLDANDEGVVQVVEWLWQYAFEQRASDIHLEPRREMGIIRFRIDGVLHTVYQVPLSVMAAMTSRIKLLGRMDVVEKRRPLDGRIKTRQPDGPSGPGGEVEMRLSTLPTAFGEKMVMRIFDPETTRKSIASLGFGGREEARWRDLISRHHGIILVTGPTGSGKTSTLYATLRALATDEVNVSTLEDPIEMVVSSFNQTQVQPALDLGFAEGLRALLRQDPDIIMVGEIRDLETAEMAIQSALTGHLVFSTLHTNDAPSALTRLSDLGVPHYLIQAAVIGVLAQRLVRTLCPHCKQPDDSVTSETLAPLVRPWTWKGDIAACKPVGCLECRQTGYKGRVGLYELLSIGEPEKASIQRELDITALRRTAAKGGMQTLRLAGCHKVAQGQTTLEEVLRCTPGWEG